MNSGGNPEHDDFGLPRVDVQIPDDARELDRDVQAYHRELRVLRRQRLLRRLWGPLARHGLVMPLIASCLALTLLAGTLLTMFTAGRAAWIPGSVPRHSGTPTAPGPNRGRAGQPLPSASVLAGGIETPLASLAPAVLAVVPPGCRCQAALRQLAAQAVTARAELYLVGVNGTQVAGLTTRIGLPASHAVEDPGNVLAAYGHPAGLTAVLIRPDGRVAAIIPARGGQLVLGTALNAVVSGGQRS